MSRCTARLDLGVVKNETRRAMGDGKLSVCRKRTSQFLES